MTAERWRKLEGIYHAAAEKPEAQRAGYLAEACGSDVGLRSEIEALLVEGGSPLDLPAWEHDQPVSGQISPGARLGPYEVLAPIGAGGMGEVFRARDTRLDRMVAIKISKTRFSSRFQREAHAIAALNHPHICTLFDVGPNYLVLEWVEGHSLAGRIEQGRIPLGEALRIAEQIAEALGAAHEKGIVHRDLKPANIMLRPDGSVKVLDFGLAKLTSEGEVTPDSPTALSTEGILLGTAGYMSPEQVRGEAADKRADIWAFGVVLYEMLNGDRLFAGSSTGATLAAVLTHQPDLSRVPVPVRRILARCLEKDSRKRLRDIGDAMAFIDQETAAAPAIETKASRSGWIAATAFLLVAAATAIGWWRSSRPVSHPPVRVEMDLGSDVSLPTANGTSTVIISPDGTRLVYLASTGADVPKLFTRKLDETRAHALAGTGEASSPFFSPDGQWIGYTARGALHKIAIDQGAPVDLGQAGYSTGSAWGEDGTIVTAALYQGLRATAAAGGAMRQVAQPVNGEYAFLAPQLLPGGNAILYTVYPQRRNDPDAARIEILTPRDGRRKVVARGGTSARYVSAGRNAGFLVYGNKSTLFAAPFSLGRLERTGPATAILDDMAFNPITFESQFDVSRSGTLVYRKNAADPLTAIRWVNAAGRSELLGKPERYSMVRISPDGRKIAAQIRNQNTSDIEVYDPERDTWTNLTPDGSFSADPVWSPDSQTIIFASLTGLLQVRPGNANPPQVLTSEAVMQMPWSVTPDGKTLLYMEKVGSALQIWRVPLQNVAGQWTPGAPEQLFTSDSSDKDPAVSPDGKWLAYTSNSSGTDEVYVRAFPDRGSLVKISEGGGHTPLWLRQSSELLFQAGDRVMAVGYSAVGADFIPGKPRVWTERAGGLVWDISPDGKRLLILAPVSPGQRDVKEHEIALFQNFTEYLRKAAPAK